MFFVLALVWWVLTNWFFDYKKTIKFANDCDNLSRGADTFSQMPDKDRQCWLKTLSDIKIMRYGPVSDDDEKFFRYWSSYTSKLERVLTVLDDLNLALKLEFENNFEAAVKCYGKVLFKIREGKVGDDDFAYVNLHEENNETVVTTELIRQRAIAVGWKGPTE